MKHYSECNESFYTRIHFVLMFSFCCTKKNSCKTQMLNKIFSCWTWLWIIVSFPLNSKRIKKRNYFTVFAKLYCQFMSLSLFPLLTSFFNYLLITLSEAYVIKNENNTSCSVFNLAYCVSLLTSLSYHLTVTIKWIKNVELE